MPTNPKKGQKRRFLTITIGGLFFVLFVSLLTIWFGYQEIDILRRNGHQKLTLYEKVISNELRRHEYLPLVLAEDRDIVNFLLKQSDLDRKDQLNRYLEQVNEKTDASAIYLMNIEGLTIASSNWRSQDTYVGHNYSFRPYFKLSRSGKPGHYFATGATTKIPGLFLSSPVTFEGHILGVVAVKVSMAPLEQAWARQGSESAFITDAHEVIFASSVPAWKFRTLTPLTEEALQRLKQSRKYLNRNFLKLGLEPLTWAPHLIEDLVRIPLPTPAYYLKQQVPLSGTPWMLHLCSRMGPVAAAMGNVLAISFPSGLAIMLLLFYLNDHRQYLQEKKRYQLNAREKLRISAAERRAIIGHTQAALIIMTPQGKVESFNSAAERYFGYVEDEFRGQGLSQLLNPGGQIALKENFLSNSGQSGSEFQIETLGQRKDGTQFPIDLIASEIRLNRGLRIIVTIHDISRLKIAEEKLRSTLDAQEQRVRERTAELSSSNQRLLSEIAERKQAEKVLKNTQGELIQASKLAALGKMSASIVHELNQPLAAICNFSASSRLFLERNQLDQVEGNLVRIADLTERMAKITGQLKIFARKGGGERTIVSLRTALDQSMALFEERISRQGVQVRFDLPSDPLLIKGDNLRLEQVLINLICNAMDAMGETMRPQLEIAASIGPTRLRLSVCDNGPGIAEEHIGQLFDPFFTTKEVGAGLGLGLSISYGIIKDWCGTISTRNRPCGGAEFVIELPTTVERTN